MIFSRPLRISTGNISLIRPAIFSNRVKSIPEIKSHMTLTFKDENDFRDHIRFIQCFLSFIPDNLSGL